MSSPRSALSGSDASGLDPSGSSGEPSNSRITMVHKLIEHAETIIFCVMDKTKQMLLTGGADQTGYVWNLVGFHTKFECRGHHSPVVAGDFSLNSNMVASGDTDGHLNVFDCNTGNHLIVYKMDEIKWVKWHNQKEHLLLAGSTSGEFRMWHIHDRSLMRRFPNPGTSCINGAVTQHGGYAIVTYQNGTVKLWNLTDATVLITYQETSGGEITQLEVGYPAKSFFAIGCMDNTVKLINSQTFQTYATFNCATPISEKQRLNQKSKGACLEVIRHHMSRTSRGQDDRPPVLQQLKNPSSGWSSGSDKMKVDEEEGNNDDDDAQSDESFGLERVSEADEQEEEEEAEAAEEQNDEEEAHNEALEKALQEAYEAAEEELTDTEEPEDCMIAGPANPREDEDDDDDEESDGMDDDATSFDSLDLSEAVESLAFSNNSTYLVAINNIGSIYIWDVNTKTEVAKRHVGVGLSKVAWFGEFQVAVSCTDGKVRIFDKDLQPIETIDAHTEQILDMVIRDDMIVTVSDDKTASVTIMRMD